MQTCTGAHWYLVNGLLVWISKACDGLGAQSGRNNKTFIGQDLAQYHIYLVR